MAFNKFYEEELVFLHQMGAEFAQSYPNLAPFLATRGNDPDVERLLEGFAFLTGRIRQKLDDELPELTHGLMSLLWPHYLRPIPAMSILQFEPKPALVTNKQRIARGTEIDSVAVEGTSCRFRTCYDVDLLPLELEDVQSQRSGSGHRLTLEFALHNGVSVASLELDTLRLHFCGEPFISQTLYLWMCQYLTRITVQSAGRSSQAQPQPPIAVRPVGFMEDEGLLPYPPNAFMGYRLLQEYFALPQKFLFVDITGLAPVLAQLDIDERFSLVCEFSHPLGAQVRVAPHHVALHCTPIVNLFSTHADPIRIAHDQTEYRIKPSGQLPEFVEIYSVDHVLGWVQGSAERHAYEAFLSPRHEVEADDRSVAYYRTRMMPSTVGRGSDLTIAFVSANEQPVLPPTETIAIDLTCTNRHVPERLQVGDIAFATASSPEFAAFKNIMAVTPTVLPALDQRLLWHLISNMSLNYVSLVQVEAIRNLLSTYHFHALDDRQAMRAHQRRMDGIEQVHVQPIDMLLKGSPIRGMQIELTLLESHFASEGDLYLLAAVLNEFYALYATINSFHRLQVHNRERGEWYRWPTRIGQQPLM